MVNPKSLKNLSPGGRKKGQVNKCTKAKEAYFQTFFELGGKKDLKKHIKGSKKNKSTFYFHTLPSLMEKKTEVKGNIGISGSLKIEIFGREKKDDQG